MPQPTVTKQFRNPRALSSALAVLRALQPRAFGFLNRLVTLASTSNYYIVTIDLYDCFIRVNQSFIAKD